MALLPILTAPHPILKQQATPVETIDDTVRRTLDDMLETMYDAPGIGLAAPQVGISQRMLVMDVEYREKEAAPNPIKIINPDIIEVSDEDANYDEGCLSVPGHYSNVVRPAWVVVKYHDEKGVAQQLKAEGLLATCIQHEIDHLDGILFIDHISALKRNMILRKLLKSK